MYSFIHYCARRAFLLPAGFFLFSTVFSARAEDPILIREQFSVGNQHKVQSRAEIQGSLTLPSNKDAAKGKTLTISGHSAIDYEEKFLSLDKNDHVEKTLRIFGRMSFSRDLGNVKQQSSLRKSVQRMVLLRRDTTEVPFSPDGPMTWGEIDLIRTDVFVPALSGLFPDKPVVKGDRWKASAEVMRELTDFATITKGELECRFVTMTETQNRPLAKVRFEGTIEGTSEDGPGRQILNGFYYFDLRSKTLIYLTLRGRHALLDDKGKEMGFVTGRFVISRQPIESEQLSDQTLRGVELEPDRENTRLLYDNADLKLRFLYPRNWRVSSTQGAQITLDTSTGNGLLLTVDPPGKGPTARQFLQESRSWLERSKAKVTRVTAPSTVIRSPRVDRFTLEVEMSQQKFIMEYFVIQAEGGDATLAARLLPTGLKDAQREVEEMARSVRIAR